MKMSHAEDTDIWGACPSPERPRPVYQVDDIQPESKPEVSSEDQDMLDLLMRQLLPTPAVSRPRATPIPLDRELLIQRLRGPEHPVRPVLQERSNLTYIEILIQSLLPVGSVVEENVRPTVVCFSCGESGHATSRCPVLDDSFPFLPPGWQVDQMGDGFSLRPPPRGADCLRLGNVG